MKSTQRSAWLVQGVEVLQLGLVLLTDDPHVVQEQCNPREMRIALTFAKPLEVSQGDEVDSLVIFAGLGDYTDN